MKILSIEIPEYDLEKNPNLSVIGSKLDNLIKENFPGRWVAIRGVSLQDHPSKDLDWLVATIQEHGTDRYDPGRKGVHNDFDEEFGIELHATPMIYNEELFCPHYSGDRLRLDSVVGEILSDFNEGTIADRGYALRLDVFTVYDLNQLEPAPMIWKEGYGPVHTSEPISPEKSLAFRFKNPSKKSDALLGIIRVEK